MTAATRLVLNQLRNRFATIAAITTGSATLRLLPEEVGVVVAFIGLGVGLAWATIAWWGSH